MISGDSVFETAKLTPVQLALMNRHRIFTITSSVMERDPQEGEKYRQASILIRQMSLLHGVDGSALGFLSPTVTEFLVDKALVTLLDSGQDFSAADLAQFACHQIGNFDVENQEWHLDGKTPKKSASPLFAVFRPYCVRFDTPP